MLLITVTRNKLAILFKLLFSLKVTFVLTKFSFNSIECSIVVISFMLGVSEVLSEGGLFVHVKYLYLDLMRVAHPPTNAAKSDGKSTSALAVNDDSV